MRIAYRLLLVVTIAVISTGGVSARIIIKYLPDFREKLVSVEQMKFQSALTADDFTFTRHGEIHSITAFFFVDEDLPQPEEWRLKILNHDYRRNAPDDRGRTVYYASDGVGHWTRDIWDDGKKTWHIYKVTWQIDRLELDPEKYWIMPYGFNGVGLVHWISANTGAQVGSSAMLKSAELGVPDWTTWQVFTKDCLPVDGAFIMKGRGGNPPSIEENVIKRIATTEGNRIRGTRRHVMVADDQYYVSRAEVYRREAPAVTTRIKYRYRGRRVPNSVTIKLAARISDYNGLGVIVVRNWRTNRWEQKKIFAIDSVLDFQQVNLIGRDYVKEDGTILVYLRVSIPHRGREFKLFIDQMRSDSIIIR